MLFRSLGLNTANGEGWGLIPCEMSLAKIPQLVPYNTSYIEIFEDNIEMIKCIKNSYFSGRTNLNCKTDTIITIVKSYHSYRDKHIYTTDIQFDKNIVNFFISELGSDNHDISQIKLSDNINVIYHFKTLEYTINFINNMDKIPDRFQILIKTGAKFNYILNEYWCKFTKITFKNRLVIQMSKIGRAHV